MSNWSGFDNIGDLSASSDGKRVAFTRYNEQTDVPVAEMYDGATRIGPLRRLTLDDSNDGPVAWTPDSKSVIFGSDRNGPNMLFKQPLDSDTAEPLTPVSDSVFTGRLSADRQWLLYVTRNIVVEGKPPVRRLMRVPMTGGTAEVIFESTPALVALRCAPLPAGTCVYLEQTAGQRIVSTFDPMHGRIRELFRVPAGGTEPDISHIVPNPGRSLTRPIRE